MKVLLIQPPIEDFYDTSIRTYPLALLYLAVRIRDISDVIVMDMRTGHRRVVPGMHPFPDLADYYRDGVRTPFSFFGRYYRFGLDKNEIKKEIAKEKPDVVSISSLFTTYSLEAIEVARLAKEVDRGIVTVMGGIHPTLFPRHVLESASVDYVIRGEGETPLFELLTALSRGVAGKDLTINGLCFKEGGGFRISEPNIEEDIDMIPDRGFLDPAKYRIGRKNYSFLLTSRGCPFHCSFCGRPSIPYRKRSLGSIEEEIGVFKDLGIGAVDFEDDMLNLDPYFFRHVLDLLNGKGFTLSAMNGIYTGNLDTTALKRMYEAGFRRLNFSLVDISKPVMERQKRLFPWNFLSLLPWLEDSPYLVETHFIIGLPDQTPGEILETLIFLMGKRLLPGPSIFYLAPGSPIFDETVGLNWEDRVRSLRSSAMFPVNPLIPRDTLFTFMKLTRFINYVKNLADLEPGVKRLSDLAGRLPAGVSPIDWEIVSTLVRERRFVSYDPGRRQFQEEPQDASLVKRFFEQSKGLAVRGFRTSHSLKMD